MTFDPLLPLVVCGQWQNIAHTMCVCCVCVCVCASQDSREDQRTFLLIGLCMQQASKARAEQRSLVFLSLRARQATFTRWGRSCSRRWGGGHCRSLLPNNVYKTAKPPSKISFTTGSIQTIFANLVLAVFD